jgi:putative oxidoreductase
MKVATIILRILLGLVFLVFGLNKLHTFIPTGAPPAGDAGVFIGVMVSTKYFAIVGFLEALGGLLLVGNRFVPLGLTILAPIIVNIFLTALLMDQHGIAMAGAVTAMWLFLFWRYKNNFLPLFESKAKTVDA